MNRFWDKVNRPKLLRNRRCWAWVAYRDPKGYGRLNVDGQSVLAHRLAWILTNGEIPEGMCVCHKCDNPGCVNPNHLFISDHAGNMRDMAKKGRWGNDGAKGQDHPSAKLSEADVLFIRRNGHISNKELGKRLGVCRSTISHIRTHRNWRHLT